jgi:hypothetical protein
VAICLLCGVYLWSELNKKGIPAIKELYFIFAICTLIFSYLYITFNFKAIEFLKTALSKEKGILDSIIEENEEVDFQKINIPRYLEICNYIYGFLLFNIGGITLRATLHYHPFKNLPDGVFQYLLAVTLIVFGITVLVDAYRFNNWIIRGLKKDSPVS